MKIQEHQAKEIFSEYGIPVQKGIVALTPDEARSAAAQIGKMVVVKAQVLVGGRGKAGGVKLAHSPEEAGQAAEKILGMSIKGVIVKKVLIAEAADIKKEYYVGATLDRDAQQVVMMVSPAGGMDIEEVAAKTPEKIFKVWIDPIIGLRDFQARQLAYQAGFEKAQVRVVTQIIKALYRLLREKDISLCEINPLVETKGGDIQAVDAKIVFDDNASFRHPEWEDMREIEEENPLEVEARKRGLPYVKLDGNVGIIGNGAGLVMGTMDLVKLSGGKPANFLDIGGGAKAEVMKKSLELVLSDPQVKGVLINVFGGITRCDEVAKGILSVTKAMDISVPMVIRLTGTQEEEGRKLLSGSNLIPAATMREAAEKIVGLVA